MGKDTERKERINEIIKRIDLLNARLSEIPEEIETIEKAKKAVRVKAIDAAKQLQAEKDMKGSSAFVDKANIELRGMSKHLEEKWKEQARLLDEISQLEKEKKKFFKSA